MTEAAPAVLSVAPMMDRTDRHYRFFARRLSRRTLLYTEMVTSQAILRGTVDQLRYNEVEHPLSLQLGGDDPEALAECARRAEDRGYDEVNLNVGCPSPRVQTGNFGACLMTQPERVASVVRAMKKAVSIPVTVKHRIGVDDVDQYEDMLHFVKVVADAGARRFSVHARKAWLNGLSPKENRNVPPLRYEDVYRLKEELPELFIEINGGIKTIEETKEHLQKVDAVMIGRAAYDNPWLLAQADSELFGEESTAFDRHAVLLEMADYAERHIAEGGRLHSVTRHLLGAFAGRPGARAYRRHLSTHAPRAGANADVLREALALVPKIADPKKTGVRDGQESRESSG